jgi:predicted phosphatase
MRQVKVFKTKNFLNINREFEKIKSDKNLKANIGDILEAVNLVCYKNLKTDIEKYVEIISIVNETNKNIQRNANLDLALDNMILQICF